MFIWALQCDINETLIPETGPAHEVARFLGEYTFGKAHHTSLSDVGYDHVNVEDCYPEKERSSSREMHSLSYRCLQLPSVLLILHR